MKKIRILTYFDLPNNGSALQCYSVLQTLRRIFPDDDIKVYAYSATRKTVYELMKLFQLHRKSLFFNLVRYCLLKKFREKYFALDRDIPRFAGYKAAKKYLIRQKPDLLIVGSETFWRLSQKWSEIQFPNIFWLSREIRCKKIAFSPSAIQSDPKLAETSGRFIQDSVNGMDLVGVRDQYTYDLIRKSGIDDAQLERVPDATFLLEISKTDAGTILSENGMDLSKPILGVVFYGRKTFSRNIVQYFKAKGFQVIALGMYNGYADMNFGHRLDPLQWAEVFRYLSFCITDRFHGTIFCLKNMTPFLSIESQAGYTGKNSKIWSLLHDFDLLDLYENIDLQEFSLDGFQQKCSEIILNWDAAYKPTVLEKLKDMQEKSLKFVSQITF